MEGDPPGNSGSIPPVPDLVSDSSDEDAGQQDPSDDDDDEDDYEGYQHPLEAEVDPVRLDSYAEPLDRAEDFDPDEYPEDLDLDQPLDWSAPGVEAPLDSDDDEWFDPRDKLYIYDDLQVDRAQSLRKEALVRAIRDEARRIEAGMRHPRGESLHVPRLASHPPTEYGDAVEPADVQFVREQTRRARALAGWRPAQGSSTTTKVPGWLKKRLRDAIYQYGYVPQSYNELGPKHDDNWRDRLRDYRAQEQARVQASYDRAHKAESEELEHNIRAASTPQSRREARQLATYLERRHTYSMWLKSNGHRAGIAQRFLARQQIMETGRPPVGVPEDPAHEARRRDRKTRNSTYFNARTRPPPVLGAQELERRLLQMDVNMYLEWQRVDTLMNTGQIAFAPTADPLLDANNRVEIRNFLSDMHIAVRQARRAEKQWAADHGLPERLTLPRPQRGDDRVGRIARLYVMNRNRTRASQRYLSYHPELDATQINQAVASFNRGIPPTPPAPSPPDVIRLTDDEYRNPQFYALPDAPRLQPSVAQLVQQRFALLARRARLRDAAYDQGPSTSGSTHIPETATTAEPMHLDLTQPDEQTLYEAGGNPPDDPEPSGSSVVAGDQEAELSARTQRLIDSWTSPHQNYVNSLAILPSRQATLDHMAQAQGMPGGAGADQGFLEGLLDTLTDLF
jgi:hypothetical protein